MIEPGLKSSGHTKTPISYDAMRISPVGLAASPQACFEMLADVRRPQSMHDSFDRMYVLICGAALLRPLSCKEVLLGSSWKLLNSIRRRDGTQLTSTLGGIVGPMMENWAKIFELLRLL